MAYTTIEFGQYESGSMLTFEATNIAASKEIGTLKQVFGKRIIQRQILSRDILDWNIRIDGIFTGSTAQIDEFKKSMNAMIGDKQYYNDGNTEHEGSYLIANGGFDVDEEPDKYDNEYITFSLDLIQLNQEGWA